MSGSTLSNNGVSPSSPINGGVVVMKAPRTAGGKRSTVAVSREAQRVAAAVLEVLAGVHTPTQAAAALELSVPRYYLWEQRALEGLVRACEPRPKGKAASERHRIAALEKEVVRLRQDCTRQQALVRASQRTIALGPSSAAAKGSGKAGVKAAAKPGGQATKAADKSAGGANGKAKRKRRPVVRALTAAVALQAAAREADRGENLADSSSAGYPEQPLAGRGSVADVVQQSVTNSSAAGAGTAQRSAAHAATALPEA